MLFPWVFQAYVHKMFKTLGNLVTKRKDHRNSSLWSESARPGAGPKVRGGAMTPAFNLWSRPRRTCTDSAPSTLRHREPSTGPKILFIHSGERQQRDGYEPQNTTCFNLHQFQCIDSTVFIPCFDAGSIQIPKYDKSKKT